MFWVVLGDVLLLLLINKKQMVDQQPPPIGHLSIDDDTKFGQSLENAITIQNARIVRYHVNITICRAFVREANKFEYFPRFHSGKTQKSELNKLKAKNKESLETDKMNTARKFP